MRRSNRSNNPRSASVSNPTWQKVFPWIATSITLIGISFILGSNLISATTQNSSAFLVTALRDIGSTLFIPGLISLIFEFFLKRDYMQASETAVRKAFDDKAQFLAETTADIIARRLDEVEIQKKKFGLSKMMTRTELEGSDIAFSAIVELLKNATLDNEKEFFILGKTLAFISIDTLLEGIRNGVNFKLSIVDPDLYPKDASYFKILKEEAERSINRIERLKDRPSENSWMGKLELRKIRYFVEGSFSSFVRQGKRVSVLEVDPGDIFDPDSFSDLSSRCSQIYVHNIDDRNFASHLYMRNMRKYESSPTIFTYPKVMPQ